MMYLRILKQLTMKVSNEFLVAKKDKGLNSLLVISRTDSDSNVHRTFLRLCIDVKIKFTDRRESVFVECDTKVDVTNYSTYKTYEDGNETHNPKRSTDKICFHNSIYGDSHITTFLNNIRKDSEVSFKVIAYNSSEFLNRNNMVSHSLYGYIDNKCYLLDKYTGADNSASPVQ